MDRRSVQTVTEDRAQESQDDHVHSAVSVSRIDEVQPPGRYLVETEEVLLPDPLVSRLRRRATLIWLRSQPGQPIRNQAVEIDSLELQAAQERESPTA